jgi:hypothetical protein
VTTATRHIETTIQTACTLLREANGVLERLTPATTEAEKIKILLAAAEATARAAALVAAASQTLRRGT